MDYDTVHALRARAERRRRDYHRALLLALSRFPSDADKVADTLYELGIRGRRHVAIGDPLSVYLTVATERFTYVAPHEVCTVIDDELYTWPLAEEVREFLVRFDAGEYPQLYGDPNHGRMVPVLRWEKV